MRTGAFVAVATSAQQQPQLRNLASCTPVEAAPANVEPSSAWLPKRLTKGVQ